MFAAFVILEALQDSPGSKPAPLVGTRAKLNRILEDAKREKEEALSLWTMAKTQLSNAEVILAKAKANPDYLNAHKVAVERAPQAIENAKGLIEKGQTAIDKANYRIKLTERAIENLPAVESAEGKIELLAHRALPRYAKPISKELDETWAVKPGFLDDPERIKKASRIVDRLLAVSPSPGEKLSVKILDTPNIGRMAAASSTTIYIERAYLDLNPSDSELMFVLGHELAHVQVDHYIKYVAVLVGEEKLNRLETLADGHPDVRQAIQKAAAKLADWKFSFGRGQEQEADLVGAQLAIAAGASPRGIGASLVRMQEHHERVMAGLSEAARAEQALKSDHPLPLQRRRYLEEAIGIKFD